MPNIVLANRLSDGLIVTLTEAGEWSTDLSHAKIADDEATDAALNAAADEADRTNKVTGPGLVAVEIGEAGPVPLSLRDRIRFLGPTVAGSKAAMLATKAAAAPIRPRAKA